MAQLEGVKTAYGTRILKEPESTFFEIWHSRRMYLFTGMWLILFGMLWVLTGRNVRLIRTADLIVTYGLLAVIDLKRRIVPDWILVCYLAGQLLLGALSMMPGQLFETCLTGGIFGAVLWVFSRFSGEKMGQGDVKLLCATAMTAGWIYTFQTFALGLALSFLYSIYLVFARRKSMETEIPFVPFLTVGNGILMAAVLFG